MVNSSIVGVTLTWQWVDLIIRVEIIFMPSRGPVVNIFNPTHAEIKINLNMST